MVFLVEQHMDVERAGARQHPHDKEVGRQQQVSAGPHEENWNQEEWRVVAFVGEVIREARASGTLSVKRHGGVDPLWGGSGGLRATYNGLLAMTSTARLCSCVGFSWKCGRHRQCVQLAMLDYAKLTPVLVEAIKELQKNNDNQALILKALGDEFRSYRAAHP